jgi:hypothetical protein
MNPLTKLFIFIFIVISILVGSFYLIGKEKSGNVMDVSVTVFLDNGGIPHIAQVNGTLRESYKVSIPRGNEVITPGVVANVIYNNELIGYWTSVGINTTIPLNSTTTYNLTVGLLVNPARGDKVSISARLVGFRGEEFDSVMTTLIP